MFRRSMFVLLAAAAPALFSAQASAQFKGDLAFDPDACKAKRECILKNTLVFIDPNQEVWQADAGDITDGASIPDWAQSVIGDPWDESYLKAAIIHDHYCGNHVRSWRDTHLMFYKALIDLGVSEFKAKIMYYAVYLGGPRWIDVLSPVDCGGLSAGKCIKDSSLKVINTIMQPERYDQMDMHKEMSAVEDYVKAKPGTSLEDLEKMAQARHPENMYYHFGGGILADVAAKRGVK